MKVRQLTALPAESTTFTLLAITQVLFFNTKPGSKVTGGPNPSGGGRDVAPCSDGSKGTINSLAAGFHVLIHASGSPVEENDRLMNI